MLRHISCTLRLLLLCQFVPQLWTDMTVLSSLTAFLLLAVSLPIAVHAAIGPETKLHIVNAEVNPDGVPRQGVLAEGVFPGPLIRGKKVYGCRWLASYSC